MSFIFPADRFPSLAPPRERTDKTLYSLDLWDTFATDTADDTDVHSQGSFFEFTPTAEEVRAGCMDVKYSAATDDYVRAGSGKKMKKWNKGTWRYWNIERKEETDWKMAYLAREDNPHADLDALIEWKFNLKPASMKVEELRVRLPWKTYRDGKVKVWIVSRDDYTVPLDTQNLKTVHRARGWDEFVIRAELTGVGDFTSDRGTTYQNAQICRQPLTELRKDWFFAFHVVVDLEAAGS